MTDGQEPKAFITQEQAREMFSIVRQSLRNMANYCETQAANMEQMMVENCPDILAEPVSGSEAKAEGSDTEA